MKKFSFPHLGLPSCVLGYWINAENTSTETEYLIHKNVRSGGFMRHFELKNCRGTPPPSAGVLGQLFSQAFLHNVYMAQILKNGC